MVEDKDYMSFITSEQMGCFVCGEYRHVRADRRAARPRHRQTEQSSDSAARTVPGNQHRLAPEWVCSSHSTINEPQ